MFIVGSLSLKLDVRCWLFSVGSVHCEAQELLVSFSQWLGGALLVFGTHIT